MNVGGAWKSKYLYAAWWDMPVDNICSVTSLCYNSSEMISFIPAITSIA